MPEVSLRPLTAADLPEVFRWQSDPEAIAVAVVFPRDWPTFERHFLAAIADPRVRARGILFGETLVGTISCFVREQKPMVGYWIDRAFWGRGIASQALALLLAEEPRRPLFAQAARSNTGSVRVLEHGGFVCTKEEWAEATERYPACVEAHFVLA